MKIILFALLLFSAISPAYASDDEYAFILRARSNQYWEVMGQGIKEAAHVLGVKAEIYQTQTDVSAEEQLNICQAMLARQPKVLAISAITVSVGVQCMKEAAAKGIIVADMDAGLLPGDAEKHGIPLAFTVGSDNYLIGQEAAKYLGSVTSKSNPKILVIEGAPSSTQGTKRAVGFKDGVKVAIPEAVIVASISAEWDRLKAMTITTDILQRHPDLDVIYAANDLMALGAVEATRIAQKSKQITIIGVDGTKAARDAVLADRMTASVAQLPYLIGKRSVEKAVEAASGKKVKQVEVTPTPVLDKKTLRDNKADFLKYVR